MTTTQITTEHLKEIYNMGKINLSFQNHTELLISPEGKLFTYIPNTYNLSDEISIEQLNTDNSILMKRERDDKYQTYMRLKQMFEPNIV